MRPASMEIAEATREPSGGDLVRKHRLSTRLWHWINAATLVVMLMSGLMIFNAHPRLYWGQYGANPDYAWLAIGNRDDQGYLRIGSVTLNTTGVLGLWQDSNGRTQARAFPAWATIPSSYDLALSRRWHLTFAWLFAVGIVVYGLWSLFNGHLRRDLAPRGAELRPGNVWRSVKAHALLRFPTGEAARRYNILQKASYFLVIVVLIPLMVLTGLTMSPSIDASWTWLLYALGGRQSARSIHFITASLLVLFIIVHLVMVLLAGPFNEIRSIVTGRYRLPKERANDA